MIIDFIEIFYAHVDYFFLLCCAFIFYIIEFCLKDGIEVDKSTVQCDIKTGCRLIQKTGECCPEYQCGNFIFNLCSEILHNTREKKKGEEKLLSTSLSYVARVNAFNAKQIKAINLLLLCENTVH